MSPGTSERGMMNPSSEIAEQRRSIRYACVLEARVPRVGSRIFEPVLLVKVANISTGGIGLHSTEKLEAGSILTLKIYKRERK
ncbi:MAG: PilZ domain-containing protein, partial [Gemmataceae bacterium]